ncbi:LysR family transcriptional regulator [Achromobacter piechaudii]|uniref:immunity 52 family protein n=1 Tax=Achromobacter piechaudii TaxID=72556 RepID=UPI0006800B13|nr:immunity 52 family protein [Achromobacter piechaudii]KNY08930.1 LysR family transcriptional regulator [Achromobacter piechaudii]
MEIKSQFRDESLRPDDFSEALHRLHIITSAMAEKSNSLGPWYAQGESLQESLLYPAFDGDTASSALLAVLKHKYRNDASDTHIALWDGNEDDSKGATIACHIGDKFLPDSLGITLYDDKQLGNSPSIKDIVLKIVEVFRPYYVAIFPSRYTELKVFSDKPAVGWMLYLPQVITTEQVPEAQALIPVPAAGKKQTGTIIVSVADAVFSVGNPSHVDLANRIEMRLVDQDLLPRYVDL